MGAVPFSALNLVAFPADTLPLSVLSTILQGGADAVREAGAMMLGGHSIVDTGIKFGLAVTGLVAPGKQVTNAGARAGDALYLTKPLGTGCLTTGARKQQVDADVLRGAMESMGRLNKAACEAMVAVGVNAATDVTGYGLIGHAAEMAAGSRLELVLEASSLPLLPGAEAAMRAGHGSGGAGRTLQHLGERLAVEGGVDETFRRLAADSETSGGLLIAVPPAREAALRAALEERGVLARRIGEARAPAGAVAIRLVR